MNGLLLFPRAPINKSFLKNISMKIFKRSLAVLGILEPDLAKLSA